MKGSVEKILQEIYSLHIRPAKFFEGALLRWKIRLQKSFLYLLALFSGFLVIFLYLITGDEYDYRLLEEYVGFRSPGVKVDPAFPSSIFSTSKPKRIDEKNSRRIKIFEYEASAWTIFAYCAVNLSLFSLFYFLNYESIFLKIILNNYYLTALYAFFTLYLFGNIIPRFLKYLIGKTAKLFLKIQRIELKI